MNNNKITEFEIMSVVRYQLLQGRGERTYDDKFCSLAMQVVNEVG